MRSRRIGHSDSGPDIDPESGKEAAESSADDKGASDSVGSD